MTRMAVILAGGLGTRLRAITHDRYVKPMIPVPLGNESVPFLEFPVALLRYHGVTDLVMCIGHLGAQVQDHFGDGSQFGLRISYHDAGAARTASRVLRAIEQGRVRADEFLVVCGDVFHPLDLQAFMAHFLQMQSWRMLLAIKQSDPHTSANVALAADGRVLEYHAHGGVQGRDIGLDTGVLALRHQALDGFDARDDLSLNDDVYPALIARGQLGGLHSYADFFDIGTPERYRRFCSFVHHGGAVPVSRAKAPPERSAHWLPVLLVCVALSTTSVTDLAHAQGQTAARGQGASTIHAPMSSPISSPGGPADARLSGGRILIIAPPQANAEFEPLAALLAERLSLEVRVTDNAHYAPLIDEIGHDGFVYLGSDYDSEPKPGLLSDMARTSKPIVWINYHAWLLPEGLLSAHGLDIQDSHSQEFNALAYHEVASLPPDTDTTWVQVSDARDAADVLYWLYDESRLRSQPGAVRAGNITYLSYLPSLSPDAADTHALVAALRASFGERMTRGPPRPDFDQRVRAARADASWSGIHLPVYRADSQDDAVGYDSDRLHDNLLRIRDTGAEWVTIGRIHFQNGIRAARIYEDPGLTPTYESIADIVEDAHKLGLLVRFSPIVNLSESTAQGRWRGMIRPRHVARWWQDYRQLILRAAEFARDHEVEALNVGSELNAMQVDDREWRALIAEIRQNVGYRGLIGYQMNYDLLRLSWRDALDYVAIAAYWPVAGDRDPKLSELVDSWSVIGPRLERWVASSPVRVEFGEVGYASQPYASVHPYSWKAHKKRGLSLSEQETCYVALQHFLSRAPWLAGVHLFASTEDDLNTESIGYSPFGKPAERVVREIIQFNNQRGVVEP